MAAAIAQQVVGATVAGVGDVMKDVGAAIHPGQMQMDMNAARLGLNVEETLYLKDKNGINENFILDQLPTDKLVQDVCCPVCCTHIPYVSEKHKLEYQKICGCCKCKWGVKVDDRDVGAMTDVGCCENGCLFCCCPCLTCDGHIKVMGMKDANKVEKFVFLSKLFPCWPLALACGFFFSGWGALYAGCEGCYNYTNGTSIKTITQPVYKGPWSRRSATAPPEQIGTFYITQRWNPCCLCMAIPTPLRYYYKPTTAEGAIVLTEEQSLLSLVLGLYRGLPGPCKVFSTADFRTPTGIPCLDIGLETQTSWSSPKDVLKETK
mmetsp:Transcript_63852/g.140604  ORF Transcript_63852/g.140604 Transcript_63852/m.140604 type:complete len:320 (-) Transcript_63852:361-1320(-)